MHRVFVSFYHRDDQGYKDSLVDWAEKNKVFIDGSVDTGDIDDDLDDQDIREIIRDDYLRDTSVTIVLVGPNTRHRKHVDWEIYSSMYDGKKNKKSGLVVILLPSTGNDHCHIPYANEKSAIYPEIKDWTHINTRAEYESRYPEMPERIIDNLMKDGVDISVVSWDKLTPDNLRLMLDNAYNARTTQQYDLSRPMRRRNGA